MLQTFYSTKGDSIHYIDGRKHDPFNLNESAPSRLSDAQEWLTERGFSLVIPCKEEWRDYRPDPCDVRLRKD